MNNDFARLDLPRNDKQILLDSELKLEKVRKLLIDQDLSGIILSRRENFSWLTTGGDATVINSSHDAIGCVLVTIDHFFFICHSMDGRRILEEQLPGQAFELIELKWYESSPMEKALQMAGDNPAADVFIPTGQNISGKILDLHYPMTNLEFDRLEWIGRRMNEFFIEMGEFLKPGMYETEIAAYFECIQAKKGIKPDVLIAGGDERVLKYRHPMPGIHKVKKHLMLHSASNKWGLHAPITRIFCFGSPSNELLLAYKAVEQIQTKIFSLLKPGVRYSEIFKHIKNAYNECEYQNEWENHVQGGPTGYTIVDGQRLLSNKQVQKYTPFEWFSTVPGAKIAELTLLGEELPVIVSVSDPWPQKIIEVEGLSVKMPGMFIVE